MCAAVLDDFRDQLELLFKAKAAEAVEEAVNTIMQQVEGDLRHETDIRTMSEIFQINFKVKRHLL